MWEKRETNASVGAARISARVDQTSASIIALAFRTTFVAAIVPSTARARVTSRRFAGETRSRMKRSSRPASRAGAENAKRTSSRARPAGEAALYVVTFLSSAASASGKISSCDASMASADHQRQPSVWIFSSGVKRSVDGANDSVRIRK